MHTVIFERGNFLMSGAGGEMLSSSNGVQWRTNILRNTDYQTLGYGGGKFVGLSGRGWIATSSDLVDWFEVPSTNGLTGLAFGNGHFVGISSTGKQVFSSIHGQIQMAPPRKLLLGKLEHPDRVFPGTHSVTPFDVHVDVPINGVR